jgi:hypothetical protein
VKGAKYRIQQLVVTRRRFQANQLLAEVLHKLPSFDQEILTQLVVKLGIHVRCP